MANMAMYEYRNEILINYFLNVLKNEIAESILVRMDQKCLRHWVFFF